MPHTRMREYDRPKIVLNKKRRAENSARPFRLDTLFRLWTFSVGEVRFKNAARSRNRRVAREGRCGRARIARAAAGASNLRVVGKRYAFRPRLISGMFHGVTPFRRALVSRRFPEDMRPRVAGGSVERLTRASRAPQPRLAASAQRESTLLPDVHVSFRALDCRRALHPVRITFGRRPTRVLTAS